MTSLFSELKYLRATKRSVCSSCSNGLEKFKCACTHTIIVRVCGLRVRACVHVRACACGLRVRVACVCAVCVSLYQCACVHVCLCVVCVSVYGCACVYVCVWSVCLCMCAHACVGVWSVCPCMCACVCTHARVCGLHVHACVHVCVQRSREGKTYREQESTG